MSTLNSDVTCMYDPEVVSKYPADNYQTKIILVLLAAASHTLSAD